MKFSWTRFSILVILGLSSAGIAFATTQSSTNFQNVDPSIGSSLFDTTSTGFQITGSIEPIVSVSQSGTYVLRHGVSLREVTVISPTPTPTPTPTGGGGGGGGGGGAGPTPPVTGAKFSGRAYPLSHVTLLKDGQVAVTTIAGPDAQFTMMLTGLSSGSYNFAIYGEDDKGRRSALFTFPLTITTGATTEISGIFLSPTIDVDKDTVKKGDNLVVFGQTVPNGDLTINIHSDQELLGTTKSDSSGAYLYNLDTTPLDNGSHAAKSKTMITSLNEVSAYSPSVSFQVGDATILKQPPATTCGKADLNCDGRVNLVDFSIAAYWYKRTLSDAFKKIEAERLNGDGKITLVDFSIMAYYWTG